MPNAAPAKIKAFTFMNTARLAGLLRQYTREELRAIAKKHNIPRGQNAEDTIHNIVSADIRITVGIIA